MLDQKAERSWVLWGIDCFQKLNLHHSSTIANPNKSLTRWIFFSIMNFQNLKGSQSPLSHLTVTYFTDRNAANSTLKTLTLWNRIPIIAKTSSNPVKGPRWSVRRMGDEVQQVEGNLFSTSESGSLPIARQRSQSHRRHRCEDLPSRSSLPI